MRLLTWNVSMDPASIEERMEAICEEVAELAPDVVALQEVTETSLELLERGAWFAQAEGVAISDPTNAYHTLLYSKDGFAWRERVSFPGSRMGRDLVVGELLGAPLVVATSHLESLPSFARERRAQLAAALERLARHPDVCLMGDMNLIPGLDPEPELPEGWQDAWLALGQEEEQGLTYDAARNPIAKRYRTRLDRVFCRLSSFELESIELVGTVAIAPGLACSDHFGLAAELRDGAL